MAGMKRYDTFQDPIEDRERDERLARAATLQQEKLRQSLTWLMADPRGRRAIRWVLDVCAWGRSCSADNALRMARLSGMQDVGKEIAAVLEGLAPDDWDKSRREARDERRELDGIRDHGSVGSDD